MVGPPHRAVGGALNALNALMAPIALGVLGAALGCTRTEREPITIDLDPPAASYVIGLARDGDLTVIAIDGDGQGAAALPAYPDFAPDRPLELIAYAYDVPLASLGIAPGLLAPSRTGGGLPRPSRRGQRRVDALGPGAWSVTTAEHDPRLESFRSDGLPSSGCVSFEPRAVRLQGARDPIVALVPDGADLLALTGTPDISAVGDGELWRVTLGEVPAAARLDDVPGLDEIHALGPIVTAAQGQDGRTWISVGGYQQLGVTGFWVGTPRLGFRRLPTAGSPAEWAWWMVVDARPEGARLWTLTDYGTVHRYDELSETWTQLSPAGPQRQGVCNSPTSRCGGLALTDDGTVIVADPRDDRRVYRSEGDTLVPEALPPTSDPLTCLASTPLGPVMVHSSQLATTFSLRAADGSWSLLGGPSGETAFNTQRTFAITAWRDGFVASGRYGFVNQRAAATFCPPVDAVAPGALVSYLLEVPGGLALATGWNADTGSVPAEVVIARSVP